MGLDTVELVMSFEEEFGISIPDSSAEKMATPKDIINFVHEATGVQRDDIARKIKEIVLEQLGLPESSYGEDERFIEDFGAD